MSDIIAKVISQNGTCAAGHKVNDEFFIGHNTPPNFCGWAFYTLFPFATVLRLGGSCYWSKDPNKTIVACPDALNPVIFELSRRQP